MKMMKMMALVLLIAVLAKQSIHAQSMSKKYKTVAAEMVINASADRVWEAMVLDYGEISNFSPYIYASHYEAGSLKGELNAQRKCAFNEKGNQWTHEQIVEIDNQAKVMKNVVIDANKFPLDTDNSFAYYRVKDNGNGTSTASYEFRFRTKPSFMTGMVKGQFQKTLDDTLTGLKHYIETGDKVNASLGNWKEVRKLYSSK